MPNMSNIKNPMPSQAPDVRNKNFDEVALGYTEEIALNEADRCLHCKNSPCMQGCPVSINIPEFIASIRAKKYDEAYDDVRVELLPERAEEYYRQVLEKEGTQPPDREEIEKILARMPKE